jgi:hypothetical protein
LSDTEGKSPKITNVSWGRIQLEDGQVFKDAKLYPGGGRGWDWRETGTGHSPGIMPADVVELLNRGAKVVVLSQGMYGRLQVAPETLSLLAERGIVTLVHRTEEAVQVYNRLRETELVGGLFHSTC